MSIDIGLLNKQVVDQFPYRTTKTLAIAGDIKLRGLDSNQRPRGYEPRELPGCSTPPKYRNEIVAVVEGMLFGR